MPQSNYGSATKSKNFSSTIMNSATYSNRSSVITEYKESKNSELKSSPFKKQDQQLSMQQFKSEISLKDSTLESIPNTIKKALEDNKKVNQTPLLFIDINLGEE